MPRIKTGFTIAASERMPISIERGIAVLWLQTTIQWLLVRVRKDSHHIVAAPGVLISREV